MTITNIFFQIILAGYRVLHVMHIYAYFLRFWAFYAFSYSFFLLFIGLQEFLQSLSLPLLAFGPLLPPGPFLPIDAIDSKRVILSPFYSVNSIGVTRCWMTLIDADWLWFMLIYADWFWLMLFDSDCCCLMLIDADWCSNRFQPGFILSEHTFGIFSSHF